MTTLALRPQGLVSSLRADAWTTPASAPSDPSFIPIYLADTDPGNTVIAHQGNLSMQLRVTLADLALAADERIEQVRVHFGYSNLGNWTHTTVTLYSNGTAINFGPFGAAPFYGTLDTAWVSQDAGHGAGEWTAPNVNALELEFTDDGSGNGLVELLWAQLQVSVQKKPVVQITSPSGPQNSRRPNFTWSPNTWDSSVPVDHVIAKVYTQAQYSAVGFNPDVTAVTQPSIDTNVPITSWVPGADIPDGVYRLYVKVARNFAATNTDWWSDWVYIDFTLTDQPAVPTSVSVTPYSTDVPLLQSYIPAGSLGSPEKTVWQLATDAAFTTNVRTVTEPDSAHTVPGTFTGFRISGAHSYPLPDALQLYQGTWWVRAHSVDTLGNVSDWTQGTSFVVAHAPSAANLSPSGDQTVAFGATVPLLWSFSDPSSVDFQTAFQVVVERNDTGVLVLDSGKVVSGNQSYNAAIPAAQKDQPLRWKIRVWDSDDVTAGYGGYVLFRTSDAPVVAVTSPADFSDVDHPSPTFEWTVTESGGRTQAAFHVIVKEGTDVVHDSGWINSAVLSYTPSSAIVENGHTYVVEVHVRDTVGLESSDTSIFDAVWVPPAEPVFAVTDEVNANGYVLVHFTNAQKDATFTRYEIWRRLTGETDWEVLQTYTVDQANYDFDNWIVASNQEYDYTVVQWADRFGTEVPSAANVTTITTGGDEYWLLYGDDPSLNMKLTVTADDFTDEYESETTHIIGRGRHVDYGDELGYAGQLTARMWDEATMTARQKRIAVESLKKQKATLFLRNPFGDIWLVAAGDLHFTRTPGVGQREFGEMTVPYTQVS